MSDKRKAQNESHGASNKHVKHMSAEEIDSVLDAADEVLEVSDLCTLTFAQ